jgi:hypothetical protein
LKDVPQILSYSRLRLSIGALSLVFNYKSGDDKTKLVATAEQIRTELQAQIPTNASLFKTVH